MNSFYSFPVFLNVDVMNFFNGGTKMANYPALRLSLLLAIVSDVYCAEPYENVMKVLDTYPLPDLNYDYNEMGPFIDTRTMQVHHQGHHAAYTSKMNQALKEWRASDEKNEILSAPLLKILQRLDEVPEKWRKSLRNNGGGYVNHAFYFGTMSPNPSGELRSPTPTLNLYIKHSFGNFSALKKWMTKEAMQLFGSGYVWLCREPKRDYLTIFSTVNQQSPVSYELEPILVIDLWEHAYYLKHQNKRARYIEDWWSVVDWLKVEKLLHWWRKPISEQKMHTEL